MSFQVDLHDKNKKFVVNVDETILEAALYQDVALPYGCQSGGCGACKARIIKGEISYEYEPPGLSPEEKSKGYVLLCQAKAISDLLIQIEELPDHHSIQVRNIPVRVERKERLGHDVMGLWLKLPKGELFEYLAGQYIDIMLRDGRRRSFSIATAPENFRNTGLLELHLRHVPGGKFTDHVFNEMTDRAMLRIEGPLGGFYLREDTNRPILMIAGGTGYAPMKAMLEQALARNLDRQIHFYWGVRSPVDLYSSESIGELCREMRNLEFTPVFSDSTANNEGHSRTGFVHSAVAKDYPDLSGFDVYMSGPPPMIEAGKQVFSIQGLPTTQLYYDSFDYAYLTWPDKENTE